MRFLSNPLTSNNNFFKSCESSRWPPLKCFNFHFGWSSQVFFLIYLLIYFLSTGYCDFRKESFHGKKWHGFHVLWNILVSNFDSAQAPWDQASRLKSSMPFKRDLGLQNKPLSKQPFKTQPPKLKMKMSLEVLIIIYPPQEPTSVGHCHYEKWS